MVYRHTIDATTYVFDDLRDLLAKATPPRSGDRLAGIAAESAEADDRGADRAGRRSAEAIPARSRHPLRRRRGHPPDRRYATTRRPLPRISSLTVGAFRDWLLSDAATTRSRCGTLSRGHHAGNGRGGLKADAQPGPHPGREEMPGDHGLSQHHRPARADERAAAAQSSLRRSPRASPPRSSTASCWDRAMPASASIRPATIRP